MGGNIKFPLETKRIESKEAFNNLYQEQLSLLSSITKELYLPRELSSKTSFGDLDLVVPEEFLYPVTAFLEASGLPLQVLKNTSTGMIENNVVSYQYNLHQVDLIFLPRESLEYSVHFFSFGDHSNILGRLLKTADVSNGFKGLVHVLYNNGNSKRSITLSLNYYDMLSYLKLDVEHFKKGFHDNKELFDWITSSPYFIEGIYAFDKLSSKNRIRDSKRKFYHDFLNYLETNTPFKSPLPIPSFKIQFPSFIEKEAKVLTEFNKHKLYKEKFNGKVVTKITGLTYLDLGKVMKTFRNTYSVEEVLEMEEDIFTANLLKIKDIL